MQNKAQNVLATKGVGSRVVLRSMFLEILWNYDKNQNVGFVFCLLPALRRIYPETADLKSAVWRHLEQVNTHPSMSTQLAGIAVRMEQDMAIASVMTLRKRIMASLAALGDRIFWRHVKPLASVCAVLSGWLACGYVLGSIALLVIYNVPNLYLRITGFSKGWSAGINMLQAWKSPAVDRTLVWIQGAISLALGAVAGLVVLEASTAGQLMPGNTAGLAVVAVLAVLWGLAVKLLQLRAHVILTIYLVSAAAMAIFYLIETGSVFP